MPVEAFPLEQERLFSKFDQPSKAFLKFAELYLTNCKSDPCHNPSFKSCMIRILGSINSKCVVRNNNIVDASTEVKTIKKWNGVRPKFDHVLYDFNIWLADREVKRFKINSSLQKSARKHKEMVSISNDSRFKWIDKLLQTGLCDHRKYVTWRILSPHLLNIRQLFVEESFPIIKNGWTCVTN